jgi:hypothetical protein
MLLELNQIGKREQILNIISRIDAKNTPITKMAPAGEPLTNTLVEWQADDYEDPNQDQVWPDGKDADAFGNASPNRGMLRTYIAKLQDAAMVSDLAENVSDVAGLSKGELAESMMKKLVRLGRAVEALIGSDMEMQEQAGDTPYRFRGLGKWIQATAQSVHPVPEVARPPAGSIDTTAVTSLTEVILNDVLQSSWEQTGEIDMLNLVCGATLRRQITSFVSRISAATNSVVPQIRSYDSKFNGTIDSVVTQYNGDFGQVAIVPTLFNAHPNFDGTAALARLRGYLFPTRLIKKSIKRKPRVKPIEDRGGGPRFIVDWVGALWVTNPRGCGKFAATS